MQAYIHYHDAEPAFMICPSCAACRCTQDLDRLSMAKIDFTYECRNCGVQIRQTVAKPEPLN